MATNYGFNFRGSDLDAVVHLPNERRKTLRYLSSADALDVSRMKTDPETIELWRRIAESILGYDTFEAAFRAGALGQKSAGSQA